MSGLRNIDGSENESNIQMVGSYLRAAHEIHILLVDHETETLFNTLEMLYLCGYGVTRVATAATAMSMLIESKIRFDLIMADINSPDNQSYKLLELSVTKNIPIILLSADDNMATTMKAIESGALLCLQKPMSMEMLKYIWQLVIAMRKRLRKPVTDHQRVAGSNNLDGGLEFGVVGATYVNNEVAAFGADNGNNRLEFCDVGRSNVNSGLELGALGGCVANNRLEVGAVGRGSCANDRLGFGVLGGFMVNNGQELGVVGGNNVINNGLEFRPVGGKYTADNGPEHGANRGRYVNNGLGLGMFGGNNNNVTNGLELGASGGCNMQVNKRLVAKDANNEGRELLQVISDDDSDDEEYGKGKKQMVEWTEELHGRFVYAVRKLGPGRCFPKDIKKLMNVPGLTRLQVASHLQKCRNNKWRSPEERKNQLRIQSNSARKSPPRSNNPLTRTIRFGSMPKVTRTMQQGESSCPASHPDEPSHDAGLLQNMIPAGNSSGPMNMTTMANDGEAGHHHAYNYGPPPMISCRPIAGTNAITNSALAGAETHQQVPLNPNYLDPDGSDFIEFSNIDILLQNIPDPVAVQANQNANYLRNQWSGSDPNMLETSGVPPTYYRN